MKKTLLVALLASAGISATAFGGPAEDQGYGFDTVQKPYVSIEFAKKKLDLNVDKSLPGFERFGDVDSTYSWGARLGRMVSPNVRATLNYFYSKKSKGSDQEKASVKDQQLLIGGDYLLGNQQFKPFAGVLLGYDRLDVTAADESSKKNGFTYGGQVGVDVSFTPQLSVDVGYRYLKNNQAIKFASQKVKLDHTQNMFAALNYQF